MTNETLEKANKLQFQIDELIARLNVLRRPETKFHFMSKTNILIFDLEFGSEENEIMVTTLIKFYSDKLKDLQFKFEDLK